MRVLDGVQVGELSERNKGDEIGGEMWGRVWGVLRKGDKWSV